MSITPELRAAMEVSKEARYIEIESTDGKFLTRLIDWLDRYDRVEKDSTTVHVREESREAAIDTATARLSEENEKLRKALYAAFGVMSAAVDEETKAKGWYVECVETIRAALTSSAGTNLLERLELLEKRLRGAKAMLEAKVLWDSPGVFSDGKWELWLDPDPMCIATTFTTLDEAFDAAAALTEEKTDGN